MPSAYDLSRATIKMGYALIARSICILSVMQHWCHSPLYSIPHLHHDVYQKELQHLVKIGVLKAYGTTEWAALNFINLKKIQTVIRFTDSRMSEL
jgi:hypothetical protein